MRLPTSFSFLESCSSKDLRHSLTTSFCRGGFEMKSWMALRCATHLLFLLFWIFFCILGFEKVINNNKKLTSTFLISTLNKQPKHFFLIRRSLKNKIICCHCGHAYPIRWHRCHSGHLRSKKRTHFLFGLVVDDAELGVDRFRALVEVGRLFAGKSIQGERADEGALNKNWLKY